MDVYNHCKFLRSDLKSKLNVGQYVFVCLFVHSLSTFPTDKYYHFFSICFGLGFGLLLYRPFYCKRYLLCFSSIYHPMNSSVSSDFNEVKPLFTFILKIILSIKPCAYEKHQKSYFKGLKSVFICIVCLVYFSAHVISQSFINIFVFSSHRGAVNSCCVLHSSF